MVVCCVVTMMLWRCHGDVVTVMLWCCHGDVVVLAQ